MSKKGGKFYLANFMAKLAYGVIRLLGRNASYYPGVIALKIDPLYIKHCEAPAKVIAVTGTNGKTSSNNLILSYLHGLGYTTMDNNLGSNTIHGIAGAFVKNVNLKGKANKDFAVLEIDERSSLKIFAQIRPDYLLITNLFRDSHARNAHTEFISAVLNQAIPADSKLILNSDDLISSAIKPDNPRVNFSVSTYPGEVEERNARIRDIVNCPRCNYVLEPVYIHYNHIGRYVCPNCGFANPEADYVLQDIDFAKDRASLATRTGDKVEFPLLSKNVVDLYNLTGVIACLNTVGFALPDLADLSRQVKLPASRLNIDKVGNYTFVNILAKGNNPVTISSSLKFAAQQPGRKCIVFATDVSQAINNLDFSLNVAWLYDNDFSALRNAADVKQIICTGERYLDYELRLRLGGIEDDKICLCRNETDILTCIDYENVDCIVLLHDIKNERRIEKIIKKVEAKLTGK